MTQAKFIQDCETVSKFIQCYCDNEHTKVKKSDEKIGLVYRSKELNIDLNYNLCDQCKSMLLYSYERLQECPKEQKPRCRKCLQPCYEKPKWKSLSKIMRYSGMRLGVVKIKKIFT